MIARLEWGRRGAERAAARRDVLIVVDVLRFSTAVAAAAAAGVAVYPCGEDEDTGALAARVGGEVARWNARFSLSPLSYAGAEPGTKVVLASLNGGTCCRIGASPPGGPGSAVPFGAAASAVLVGALVNAEAVAAAARKLVDTWGRAGYRWDVTVLACGERWHPSHPEGDLRFAIEDYLGAGAVLTALDRPLDPDAAVCAAAFRSSRGDLDSLLWECESGRELRQKGREADVRFAAQLDTLAVAPVLRGGFFEA